MLFVFQMNTFSSRQVLSIKTSVISLAQCSYSFWVRIIFLIYNKLIYQNLINNVRFFDRYLPEKLSHFFTPAKLSKWPTGRFLDSYLLNSIKFVARFLFEKLIVFSLKKLKKLLEQRTVSFTERYVLTLKSIHLEDE